MIFDGTCIRVVDGDTYDLGVDVKHMHPEQPVWLPRIRCSYFDAPERKESGWKEAKDALAAKLAARQLRIETHGRDSFGRLLAETFVDGQALSEWAIQRGNRPIALHIQLAR
jgi:endonuclease YncB( thermonuclease family)